VNDIRGAIAGGSVVVLFPEGTSSDGSTVLPFKSALLESAALLHAPIAAAAIDYALDDRSVADEVCYWRDMTFVPHLLNLLFKREIRANYSFSSARIRSADRKEIARAEIVALRS
jgi:lyso-ornithine lipid O-acyltransferase